MTADHPTNAPLCWPPALASLALSASLACTAAVAGPGAHGPNGEHLDGPTTGAAAGSNSSPRLEAHTDLFELVASLRADALSLLIHRFETNTPVLHAAVEVETGGIKAQAKFHDDDGDYAVADPALLKALSSPGQHALVITVRAGPDTDLLDGTLTVGTPVLAAHDHAGGGHDHAAVPGKVDAHGPGQWLTGWRGMAALSLVVLAGLAWWRLRRPAVGQPAASQTKPESQP